MGTLIVLLTAALGRAAGGGFGVHLLPSWCNRIPEVFLALLIAYAGAGNDPSLFVLNAIWSFIIIEAGHGTTQGMTGYNDHGTGGKRIQTLEKIFRPFYELCGGDIMKPAYSWYMMSIKWGLMNIPLGWYSIAMAVAAPFAYWLGYRVEKSGAVAELIAYAFLGAAIAANLGML